MENINLILFLIILIILIIIIFYNYYKKYYNNYTEINNEIAKYNANGSTNWKIKIIST
jgi:glucan phosphoethanolaminetransferase (alkaline phosphatase superfamily)